MSAREINRLSALMESDGSIVRVDYHKNGSLFKIARPA